VTKDIPRQLLKDGNIFIFIHSRCNYNASIIRGKYKDHDDNNDVWKLSNKCSHVSQIQIIMNLKVCFTPNALGYGECDATSYQTSPIEYHFSSKCSDFLYIYHRRGLL
jgi:hypothetical protein